MVTSSGVMSRVPLLWLLVLGVSLDGATSLIPDSCQGLLDVTFIMDQSESIRENDPPGKPDYNWNIFKSFVKEVVTGLPVGSGTRTALIKFSTTAETMWYLDEHTFPGTIYKAVDALQHNGGNTNTAAALNLAWRNVFQTTRGDRANAKNVIILMTDGLSTINSNQVGTVSDYLRGIGIDIYVVAIGKYIDEEELRKIVQDYSKHIIHVDDFGELKFIQTLLLHRVCELPDPDPNYEEAPECGNIMDLALIVDNSGSVKDSYPQLKRFVANLVEQFDVSPNMNRVAVVRFSDIAMLEFPLGNITDIDKMKSKILNMKFRDLDTNTAAGLRLTVREVFAESNGDRPRVTNVAVLITDGVSTVEENNTLAVATLAKQMGIKLFVVGVTDKINEAELRKISSQPSTKYYFDSTAVRYLNALIYRLVTRICSSL